jgi:hypothetical protein
LAILLYTVFFNLGSKKALLFGLLLVFYICAFLVVSFGKTIERRNLEIYDVVKQINNVIHPEDKIIIIPSRIYQSHLLNYYFNREVLILNSKKEFMDKYNSYYNYAIVIRDAISFDKKIEEASQYIMGKYKYKVIHKSDWFLVLLFDLRSKLDAQNNIEVALPENNIKINARQENPMSFANISIIGKRFYLILTRWLNAPEI